MKLNGIFQVSKHLLILLNRKYKGKEQKKRKSYYSDKKKKHSVKTRFMVNSDGTILHKTGHKRGRIHDYEIFKNKHPILLM